MWIPKWLRDQKKGIDTPFPTQVVSNEELLPRPQSKLQAQVEHLIGEMADERSKKLGMKRRDFMRSSMGMATCFAASNAVFGAKAWAVEDEETWEEAASEAAVPKGEYFIFDVQTHFTNGYALGFRDLEFVRNMGFELDNSVEAYGFDNFVKELFLDSETDVLCISGVPGKEDHLGPDGQVLEGQERTSSSPFSNVLPSWLMSQRKAQINEIAGTQRAFCQGNCAPNHYWNRDTNKPNFDELFEQMEREKNLYGIDSWKWYCHTDPGRSGDGFRMDDEELTYPFYEKSRELGINVFSCHKGFAAQSRTLGHLAHPGDVEKAAKDNPDFSFVVYHSALKHGPNEPQFNEKGFYDPETGDFEWHAELMKIKERNPDMTNVYPEIGSSFGTLAIAHPQMCQHLMGKNIKHYGSDHVIWGTDCLWWGSPQWVIDALKRFQISDELCEEFGYEKITKEDKANIFGLNAAKLYGFDVDEKMNSITKDGIQKLRAAYKEQGGQPDNAAHGWVRDDSRA